MLKIPELLAPAGNMEALTAAVENGADAVYLGIKDFSARAYADNFSTEEFREALDFAHLRGVRVYVTMNTLISDIEIEKALELMYTLDELGTDAIIVQDTGLLSLASEMVPTLPVHASTQMTIHNTEGVLFFKEKGVKRVVLARELSLEEISTIKMETGTELEVFVHGALCISYSGQCLMSSMIGGRSGNRGYCAQPCRKQYRMLGNGREIRTQGSYLLSPKDLNTSGILPDIIRTGVDSLKIEGRMKRPEYVAGVVSIYRRMIDRYAEDPDNYFVTEKESTQLEQLFNREFTTGYFKGDPGGKLMSRKRPYNRGIVVGKVKGFDNRYKKLTIELTGELEVGDGIGFEGKRDSGTIIRGMYIDNRLEKKAKKGDTIAINYDQPPKSGTIVYRTLDDSFMKELQATYTSPTPIRRIPVTIKLKAHAGKELEVSISDCDNNVSDIVSDYVVEKARKRATTTEDVKKQLSKTGNTVFEVSHMDIDMPCETFIPIKELNSTRNEAISGLERSRTGKWRRQVHQRKAIITSEDNGTKKINGHKRTLLSASVNHPVSLDHVIRGGADIVYIDTGMVSPDSGEWMSAIAHALEKGIPLYLHTPAIVKDPEMENVKRSILKAEEMGFEGIVVANTGILRYLRSIKPDGRSGMKIMTDSPMNVFNRHTLRFLNENGVDTATISTEMNLEQIRGITMYGNCEYIVHGRVQIMGSEHCLIAGLTGQEDESGPGCASNCRDRSFEIVDEKGFEFPVRTDSQCRTHIFNSRELCLLEEIPQLIRAGLSRLRIDARTIGNERVEMVTRAYRAGIDACYTGDTKHLWKGSDISEYHTRGHYHRGVQ